MNSPLLALAPMRLEARAVGRGAPGALVARTGTGAGRAAAGAETHRAAARAGRVRAVAVTGVAGGLAAGLGCGDVVVADRVLRPDGSLVAEIAAATLVAGALRRDGLTVAVGAVVSTARLVRDDRQRRALAAATGALAVDLESVALLAGDWGRPTAVVRVVADAPGRRLVSPGTASDLARALRVLRRTAPAVERWAAAVRPRTVVLASPRSFCAGVERAVETVRRGLERYGAPLYVRRQIVHNEHVVAEMEALGAVFVRELDEVPDGGTVVFSAHGVAPAVRDEARRRGLAVVDATCPLVAKVHTEIRRFRDRGHQLVLIGHPGHDETEGTLGESDDIRLVETPADVARLDLDPQRPVAYTTQTTLAPDETAETVAALRARYPQLVGPSASDICYATHNRQEAVRAIADECDVVLVVGSATSSNSRRLVEVAERAGVAAHLVDDEGDLDLAWLADAGTVGVTAGASAPEAIVGRVVRALGGLGPLDIRTEAVRS
ncbi:MAG: 4-hydroxy-3-methylbut-2-enyl diphosphate reductase, partial [Acidimicrobiales bacterium]